MIESLMGEELAYDTVPGTGAVDLEDHLKPVKLSPQAIDQASKIVPSEHWVKVGIYTWLRARAELVFKDLPASKLEGRHKVLNYKFEYGGYPLSQVGFHPNKRTVSNRYLLTLEPD